MRLDFLFTAALVTLAACGGVSDDDEVIDAGDEQADAGDEQADAGDGTGVDAADEADGGTTGKKCGGILGLQCEGTDYCDWSDDSCGVGDFTGTCRPRPSECDPGGRRVCACDTTSYENACAAAMAGADVSESPICD